ncbi:hypothetical protein BEWA_029270 [Theileria equi strain WA]|uniref:Uncharacterized protein n=1 Tax=Theileria equi strain WA TaxID=1537102 RepID=L0AWV9_THEEQ|nr:hypothetical protein BEWA_029270 [Theileria equi strain WA]AFZ80077.1 hypothetical protein BEWA_029270 [Theileria equi strain WA]|eukprot:XP_004829743.1 hypothetical protein BEWA_029270 [Theileria equi strain WA]
MSRDIDISKKCRGSCTDDPRISARTDLVGGTIDYGFCAHEKLSTWITGLNYANKPLRIEYEKGVSHTSFSTNYSMIWEATTYYRDYGNRATIQTPLLLGVKDYSGAEYKWYENLDKGNTIWRKIGNTNEFPTIDPGQGGNEFKDKLDQLACRLQGIVEINLSKDKDEEYCHNHDNDEEVYTKKVKVTLNPDIFDFPKYVTFDHIPNPQIYGTTELTIGGFNIGGTPQNVSGLHFPVKATKITIFMPACDHKPFLFHIKSENSSYNDRWFKNTGGNVWIEYNVLTGNTPDRANERVKRDFETLTGSLSVNQCKAPSEVKLDITKIPSPGKNETLYFDGNTPILVKKENPNNIPKVFLKYSHRPVTGSSNTFVVSNKLKDGQIGSMNTIHNVKGFFVYFWTENDNLPILVGIKKSSWQDGSDQPKYYSKGNSGYSHIWTPTWVSGMSELQALDDQNCSRNYAIPFEITDPTDPSQFLSNKNESACIKTTRRITESKSQPSVPGYTVQEYIINRGGTRISRVTHNGKDTTGVTLAKNDTVSKVRVYSHKPTSIPLMVEFINNGGSGSKWFYSKDKEGLTWGTLSGISNGFYKGNYPTDELTRQLDGIRCVRDNEVTLDLSYAVSSTQAPYCCNSHNTGSGYNVTVTLQSTTIIGSKALDYYKHSLTANTKLAAIKYYPHGTSDTRKYIRPSELTLPTTEQTTIYVFYCPKDPVLIYISSPGEISATGWYKKSTSAGDDSKWIKVLIGLKDPNNIKGCSPEFDLLSEVLRGLNCTDIGTCNQSKAHTKVDVSFDISSMQHSKGDVGSKGPAGSSAPPGDPGEGTQDTSTGSRSDSGLLGSLVGDMGVLLGKAGETVINLLTTPLKTNDFISPSPKTQTAAGDQSSDGAAHTDVNSPSGRETGDRVQADGTAIQDGLGPPAPGAASSEPKDDTEDNQPGGGVSYSGTAGSPTTCGGSNDPAPPPPPPQPVSPTSKVTAEDEAPTPPESGKTERSTGGLLELPIATSLWSTFGVSSGPLAGAGGLTGLGWWAFKRSKGDPWVRQVYLMDQ